MEIRVPVDLTHRGLGVEILAEGGAGQYFGCVAVAAVTRKPLQENNKKIDINYFTRVARKPTNSHQKCLATPEGGKIRILI